VNLNIYTRYKHNKLTLI